MDFLNTFQQFLQLGKISEICEDKEKDQNDNPMYARVLPLNADGVVSLLSSLLRNCAASSAT